MTTKAEQDIRRLARLKSNCICPNCGTEKKFGFSSICIKYKTFVCDMCKTSHQAVSHRVKSLTMSSWSDSEVQSLSDSNGGGNDAARRTWLARAPPVGTGGRPAKGMHVNVYKQFVVDCYERRMYYEEADAAAGLPGAAETAVVAEADGEDKGYRLADAHSLPKRLGSNSGAVASRRTAAATRVASSPTKPLAPPARTSAAPVADLLDFSAPSPTVSAAPNPPSAVVSEGGGKRGEKIGGENGGFADFDAFGTSAATAAAPDASSSSNGAGGSSFGFIGKAGDAGDGKFGFGDQTMQQHAQQQPLDAATAAASQVDPFANFGSTSTMSTTMAGSGTGTGGRSSFGFIDASSTSGLARGVDSSNGISSGGEDLFGDFSGSTATTLASHPSGQQSLQQQRQLPPQTLKKPVMNGMGGMSSNAGLISAMGATPTMHSSSSSGRADGGFSGIGGLNQQRMMSMMATTPTMQHQHQPMTAIRMNGPGGSGMGSSSFGGFGSWGVGSTNAIGSVGMSMGQGMGMGTGNGGANPIMTMNMNVMNGSFNRGGIDPTGGGMAISAMGSMGAGASSSFGGGYSGMSSSGSGMGYRNVGSAGGSVGHSSSKDPFASIFDKK